MSLLPCFWSEHHGPEETVPIVKADFYNLKLVISVHGRYTSDQLKYFPVNKALYDSPRKLRSIYANPEDITADSDSEEASVSERKYSWLRLIRHYG